MYNYMPNFTPYDMPRTSYQPQGQNLIRVSGIESAKAYQMPGANSSVALFHENEDIFYIKSTDGGGFPTIRTFRFEEVTNSPASQQAEPQVDYINREDINTLKKELRDYVKQLVSKSESTANNNYTKSKRSEDRDVTADVIV